MICAAKSRFAPIFGIGTFSYLAFFIPLSKKHFQIEFISIVRFVATAPSDGGSARGAALSTEKQDINPIKRYLV